MADGKNNFYYYIYNVQGDVIALADASTGKLVVTYTYDAWGKIVKINGIDPNSVAESSIAKLNPFRYRGYYYDTETSLYYLQSRYYDPEVGRFINADAFVSTDISSPLSANMFSYCENNPVMKQDPTGELGVVVNCLIGGAVGVISSYIGAKVTGQDFTLKDAAISFGLGAISYSPLKVVSKIITGIGAFANTYYAAKKLGAADVDAIGCGILAAGICHTSFSNLKCLGPDDVGTKAVLDLTYGTAGSLFSNYAVKSAGLKGKKQQQATRETKTTRNKLLFLISPDGTI